MIQTSTLKFLKDLKKNNTKEWFDKNRTVYESAKENFIDFTRYLIEGTGKFDKGVAGANLQAKNCITRLNRDVRFSKDKSPYKTNLFLMINEGGKKSNKACYYLQLQPANTFAGGGVYMPMPPELSKFRQEIDYNFVDWEKIVSAKSFMKIFEKGVQAPETLSRPPKGYDEDNPAIEYIKMKGFFTLQAFTDEEAQTKMFFKQVLKNFETVKPMIDFLNRAL